MLAFLLSFNFTLLLGADIQQQTFLFQILPRKDLVFEPLVQFHNRLPVQTQIPLFFNLLQDPLQDPFQVLPQVLPLGLPRGEHLHISFHQIQ